MIGHRLMGNSLQFAGDAAAGRVHYDQALLLYEPVKHRSLATRFGQDTGVVVLSYRSWALWTLGYPDTALADANRAIKHAHQMGYAGTLMFALYNAPYIHIRCGSFQRASTLANELIQLANEKDSSYWRAAATSMQGEILALTGKAVEAVKLITAGMAIMRSRGSTLLVPSYTSHLASAYAHLGQFDNAWHCIDEAMTATEASGERWFQAETDRLAGEIALLSHDHNEAKAEGYFERALTVARQQQAKSWELRAAMSLARLWRDQGKVQQARELLVPVYGWFTEGFDTRDLKEAKALLGELAS
jgi:predicted ATPase